MYFKINELLEKIKKEKDDICIRNLNWDDFKYDTTVLMFDKDENKFHEYGFSITDSLYLTKNEKPYNLTEKDYNGRWEIVEDI